jgi:hypothetical protein
VAFPALRLDVNGKPFADQLRSESRKCSKKKLQQILVSITAGPKREKQGRDSPVNQNPV